MQALILAAGMGKRLGELTSDRTKCMIELFGETLIERMLGQLARQGIRRATIVVGYRAEGVKELLGSRFADIEIEYLENPIYDKTNNIYSLYLAKQALLEDDTLLIESDLVFEDSVFERVLKDSRPNLAVVAKYQSWMDGTVLTLNDDDTISGFTSKQRFDFNLADSYFKTVNIYRFSREFSRTHYVPFLEAYCRAAGHNEYYEQVLRILTHLENPELRALRLDREKWYEIDDVQDLSNAETLFAPEDEELASYSARYGGYWRFPFILDYCYLINPFFPPKRLIEEMKSQFEPLLSQYPSGQSVNRLLAAKMFGSRSEQIVVGNGAAELIQAIFANWNGTVGVIRPSFEEYANRTAPGKLRVFTPGGPKFGYDADDLLRFCETDKVELLVLINPDNPTGHMISRQDVERLAKKLHSQGRELILDESFVDFADTPFSFLAAGTLDEHPNLTVVKSISKSYGVPGLRLGVAASSNASRMKSLSKNVSIWNINSFGEFFMQIIGKYESLYQHACKLLAEERHRLAQRLAAVGSLRVLPSQANYVFCEILLPETPNNLARRLLRDHGILVRDCSAKPGVEGSYVRFAVRSPEDNDRLVQALHDLNEVRRHLGFQS